MASLIGSAQFLPAQSAPSPATPSKSGAVKLELPPAPVKPHPLLPDAFAGWVASAPPATVIDPAQADSANASALKEYEFTHAVLATYKRDNETLTVRALSFIDTSGSYGAYTYLPQKRLA